MITSGNSRLSSVEGICGFLGFWAFVSLLTCLVATPCRAQDNAEKTLPKVLMIEFQESTSYNSGLFQAIRAQLSAAPLILDRIDLADEKTITADPLEGASTLASENGAAMVFWIEDKETCRMFFYIPGPEGGRINSRTLELDLNSNWSRYQIIAIAVASMVEGLLVTHRLVPTTPARKPLPEVAPAAETEKVATRRKWFEISAAYSGSLFAAAMVTNGACLGLGVRPVEHFVIAASFTQNAPVRVETQEYRLTLVSRNVEVFAAGRVLINSVEIRIGVAWSMDLRTDSTTFKSDKIDAASDGFKGIHALLPFVSVEWRFSERIGVFSRVGAGLAFNDTIYKIERTDGVTEELVPFLAKLSYQLGLLVEI
jgi:hypothetical protein